MKLIWRWLSDNSSSLVGLGAVATILSAVWLIPLYAWDKIGADMVLRYKIIQSTIPPEIDGLFRSFYYLRNDMQYLGKAEFSDLAKQLDEYIRRAASEQLDGSVAALQEVYDVLARLSSVKEELRRSAINRLMMDIHDFSKLELKITNDTEETIDGFRFRLEGISSLWGVEIAGTFLTTAEASLLAGSISDGHSNNVVVSPLLDDFPPQSQIEIRMFGRFGNVDPTITASGFSYEILEIGEIEKDGSITV